jgi:hypothetical protein
MEIRFRYAPPRRVSFSVRLRNRMGRPGNGCRYKTRDEHMEANQSQQLWVCLFPRRVFLSALHPGGATKPPEPDSPQEM